MERNRKRCGVTWENQQNIWRGRCQVLDPVSKFPLPCIPFQERPLGQDEIEGNISPNALTWPSPELPYPLSLPDVCKFLCVKVSHPFFPLTQQQHCESLSHNSLPSQNVSKTRSFRMSQSWFSCFVLWVVLRKAHPSI